MPRVPIALTLVAAGLAAGCTATGEVHSVSYVGPAGGVPVVRSVVAPLPPDRLFANLLDRLQQGDVEVVQSDAANGYVVVEYRGDPQPYVDCGWIVAIQNGQQDRVRAAAAETSLVRPIGAEVVTVHRAMRLDTRMVVSLRPEDGGSRVDAHAVYVLTKSLNVGTPDGARGQRRETISFETGRIGRFEGRTVCHPTGELERLAFDSLPATEIALDRPTEAGPVQTAETTDTGVPADIEFDPIVTSDLPPVGAAVTAPPLGATETTPPVGTAGTAPPLGATTTATAPDTSAPSSSSEAQPTPVASSPSAPLEAPTTLEAALAQLDTGFDCAAIASDVGADDIRLSGYVSDAADVERLRETLTPLAGGRPIDTSAVTVTPWPYCGILEVLAPYREPGSALIVSTVDGTNRLSRGDPLTLDVSIPPDTQYLYMGYVQSDGQVGYIATMSVREWAKVGRIRFRTGYDINEPFGQEMIVAVTSESPLFDDARPAFEPAEQYLPALRQALADLRARSPNAPLEASHLFIVTEPGPPES